MPVKMTYKIDILHALKEIGYNTARIRAENIFPQSTLQRLREKKAVSLETIAKLCKYLNCKPEDIVEYEYIEDEPQTTE